MKTISLEELAKLCKASETRKTLHIVDVSAREKFAREHIAYSFNVPLEDLEKKKESGLPPDRTVVVYGETAEDANKGAEVYQKMGYKTVVFQEGLSAWKAAELPVAA
jgi:rhodanese-related sulfurtransferase